MLSIEFYGYVRYKFEGKNINSIKIDKKKKEKKRSDNIHMTVKYVNRHYKKNEI